MSLKNKISQITRWGVQGNMPIYEQKSIILVNYIALLMLPIMLFSSFLVFYWFRKVTPITIAQSLNALLGFTILFLNSKNKTILSRILICIFPSIFVIFASIVSKLNGVSNTLIFAFVPQIFSVIILLIPIILLNGKKWYLLLIGQSTSVIIFLLNKKIHAFFGIDLANLPYLVEEFDIIRIVVAILTIVLASLILFLIRLNQRYEAEITTQKDEIAAQRDSLDEKSTALHLALEEIQEQNTQITASINYAQRIQAAILPTEEEFFGAFPQSFIVFKPRDIVSGDFYFFQDIKIAEQYHKQIVAAVDCTGHGVPGAFMSMIGNELLNDIINIRDIYEADKILNELHKGVRKTLKQQNSSNRDGMDISLVVLHKKGTIFTLLEYAGAMNPIYYQQTLHHTTTFTEIKADKKAIGGQQTEEERLFTKHEIELFKDNQAISTTFYICSDGFQDQFGGTQGKKFMVKKFRELLANLATMSMTAQQQALLSTLDEWQNPTPQQHFEQIDDILVIGIQVNGTHSND